MTKGKYAQRADSRLKVLESEALQQAHAKIKELTEQLSAVKKEINEARAGIHSKAMAAAAGLSKREKEHLRDQLASMAYQHDADRMRYAVLVWEIMHRNKFGTPAPLQMERDSESHEYWLSMHWEIATLFFKEWEQIQEFFARCEGTRWRLAGSGASHLRGGMPLPPQTSREATRRLEKGRMKNSLMRRVFAMRAYFDRIEAARKTGDLEPILAFKDSRNDETPEDVRDKLIEGLKDRGQEA